MKIEELFEDRDVKSLRARYPEYTTGNFSCDDKNLTSLEGSPGIVYGNFYCYYNNFSSLEGGPLGTVDFICYSSHLKSLKGAPHQVRNFDVEDNELTSLDHAPKKVDGDFNCRRNKLTSLHNIHKQISSIGGIFSAEYNPIKSDILGLLKIKNLICIHLDDDKIDGIINKYLPEGDLIACQQELIEAGLEEYAQL